MALYFIHSRRWRENHDAAIKELPAFEITADGFLATFHAADIEDPKKECLVAAARRFGGFLERPVQLRGLGAAPSAARVA